MFKKLDEILMRYKELESLTMDPNIVRDIQQYQKYAKEMARIRGIATRYERYLKIKAEIKDLKDDLKAHEGDSDYRSLVEEELETLETEVKGLDNKLEEELFEQDSDSDKDIIMEIRAGTGGVEAALFAAELYRMYTKYSAKKGWVFERLSSSSSEKGGLKEVIFSVSGEGVYGRMYYESGTHRVQRVPVTEASGRIHTSAATVAVLPEAEDVDLKINNADLKIDVFRAGGRGGQHVNVTDSAVRITHVPSGLVVTCQDERSQHKNKAKAMRVLRTRLYEKMQKEHQDKIAQERKVQVGSGDRSEKIRTYNFPDGRVTDHRIGLTLHRLEEILEGDLDEIVDALKEEERRRMRGQS